MDSTELRFRLAKAWILASCCTSIAVADLFQSPGGNGGSLLNAQFSVDPFANVADKTPLVLDRTLQLAGCVIREDSFSSEGDLECYYCHLANDIWKAQKDDPSTLPSFRDMLGKSEHCSDHAYPFSLKEIANAARKYDAENNLQHASVAGVIVTQPSAGSSVLTNAIIVGDTSSYTYADHPAIIDLLDACETSSKEEQCQFNKQVSSMIDLLYMLSRTGHGESNIYIKLNPGSSANISVLREALDGQNVKWAYVQRDSDEVLAKAMDRKRNGCLKKRNNPSNGLLKYVNELGYNDLKGFTDEEVCSAFFAHNHQVAVNEFSSKDPNTVIFDYENDIKDKNQLLVNLNEFFKIPTDDIQVHERVKEQVNKETHSRGSRKRQQWVDEPKRMIADKVKSANEKFLGAVVQ